MYAHDRQGLLMEMSRIFTEAEDRREVYEYPYQQDRERRQSETWDLSSMAERN